MKNYYSKISLLQKLSIATEELQRNLQRIHRFIFDELSSTSF